MIFSCSLLLLVILATTVSAQTDSCATQNDFSRLLDQVIETKLNDTLPWGNTDQLVNWIGERIEGEINMTLNSKLERIVADHVASALADEPGEQGQYLLQ